MQVSRWYMPRYCGTWYCPGNRQLTLGQGQARYPLCYQGLSGEVLSPAEVYFYMAHLYDRMCSRDFQYEQRSDMGGGPCDMNTITTTASAAFAAKWSMVLLKCLCIVRDFRIAYYPHLLNERPA